MTTHENEIPDEDLPGVGMYDKEFIREQLRNSEEAGVLLWDEENSTYRTSARGVLFGIGMTVMEAAKTIDPYADQDGIMEAVVACLPWEAKAQMVTELVDLDALGPMPNPDATDFKVPETIPEEWQK